MATLDGVMRQAAATRMATNAYHARYGTWINGIMNTFSTSLAALNECIAGIDRGLGAGVAPTQAQLDELAETLEQAESSARNSAHPAQARAILASLTPRINGFTKPVGLVRPAGPQVVPPSPAEWMAGGWRPTKKISARKTRRTHSKTNKTNTKANTKANTKSNTKAKNTVNPVGGYRNRRRMMR
jgi:hypothetical protein